MSIRNIPLVEFSTAEAEVSVAERFRQQAEKYPRNIALASGEKKVSYMELNQIANGISKSILDRTEDPARPLALLCSSKERQIAALLGALKAGRIWIPLDVSHPVSRTSHVIADSGTNLILTDSDSLPAASCFPECSLVNVDAIPPNDEAPDISCDPGKASHIIYTSGSTGEPKGVIHSHRNVMESVRCYTISFGISSEDKHTLIAPLSHSGGITSVFRTLLNGATLLPYELRAVGVVDLTDWLRRERASIYHSIPYVFREFLKNDYGQFPDIRIIQLGGDHISSRDVALYRARFSDRCVLAHVLGATEVGTHSQYLIDKTTKISGGVVPAGYPLGRKEVLLVDESRTPVSHGETGEIAIKSDYIALGYWNKYEITERSFTNADDGERIYYTGDLGYFDDDHRLVLLGRKDFQAKIRGHRVELPEIEAELLTHATIENAAVIAAENDCEERSIVAFIVSGNPPGIHQELRRHLRRKLPDYMMPSVFIEVESLPLNDQYKIDRQALRRLFASHLQERGYIAPRSSAEKLVAKLWQEQFPGTKIGANSDFYSLGGDSINALRIIVRLKDECAVNLDFKDIFENPTVADLSLCLQRTKQQQSIEQEI